MAPEHDPGPESERRSRSRADEPLEPPAWDDAPPSESPESAASSAPSYSAGSAATSSASEPATSAAAGGTASTSRRSRRPESPNMLPARETRRSGFERMLVRLIATCGIVAIGVAISAIMVSNHSQGWLVGLVVSIVSVILAAILWSSKML